MPVGNDGRSEAYSFWAVGITLAANGAAHGSRAPRTGHQCRQIWCALDRGGQDRPELDDPGWNAPSDVERKRRAGRATAITAWLRDTAAGAQLAIRRRTCPGRLDRKSTRLNSSH